MQSKELFVTVPFRNNHTQAFVTVYGDDTKPQILCLHGIGSSGQESFQNLAEHLSSDFQLVTIDWLGWGRSTRLLGDNDNYGASYCSEWFQLFIKSAIDQKILQPPFHVLAVSMSAIPLAISYEIIQQYLGSVMFINPAGLDTHINKVFAFILTQSWLNHQKVANILLQKLIWNKILGWSEFHWHRLHDGITNGELDLFIRYAKAGILPNGRMKPTHVVPDKFAELQKPILLIHSRDHIFFKQQYLSFARQHDWKITHIDCKGHTPAVQQPELVAEEIRKFLKNTK